jgi:hypothetical protein
MKAVAAIALITATLLASGCAGRKPGQIAELVPIGEPQSCVLIQNIRETKIIDDWTIDFRMRDGSVFRNRLPNLCPQLGFERAFSYSTSITQLCKVDVITVLMTTSPIQRGATCGLGPFVPIAPQR